MRAANVAVTDGRDAYVRREIADRRRFQMGGDFFMSVSRVVQPQGRIAGVTRLSSCGRGESLF